MSTENNKIECGRCKSAFSIKTEAKFGPEPYIAFNIQCPLCGYSKKDVFEGKLPEGKKILKG